MPVKVETFSLCAARGKGAAECRRGSVAAGQQHRLQPRNEARTLRTIVVQPGYRLPAEGAAVPHGCRPAHPVCGLAATFASPTLSGVLVHPTGAPGGRMGTFLASKKVCGRLEPSNSSPIRPVPASRPPSDEMRLSALRSPGACSSRREGCSQSAHGRDRAPSRSGGSGGTYAVG